MLKSIFSLLGMLFFFYLVFLGYIFLFQHRMVYIPFPEVSAHPGQVGLYYDEVFLETSHGNMIHGWFVPAGQERGVVLFCHGNAGNISHRLQTLEMLNSLNMSVFIFDYQGYGKSTGSPGEQETYEDALAAWNYLVQARNVDPAKIIIFGRSLGGAVAADLATRTSPAGVVLESTFTSIPDLASEMFSFLPVRLLSRFDYNTLDKLRLISSPLKIIHSPDDEIIPYAHGRRLYEEGRHPKYFTEILGGHNTGFADSRDVYLRELDSFFSKYLM